DSSVEITQEALQALVAYDWPGNVRELENEVKKLCLVCADTGRVTKAALSPKIAGAVSPVTPMPTMVADVTAQPGEFSLYDFIADHERQFILNALSKCQGVKKHAAQLLQIPESTLRLKIKQYDIDMTHFGPMH
ncbi:MAG TPA: helix-turn-helix domain-containing protein, partial [candidate division Zixibacteria bacterium]|nr:helix-turn-helix domain-containing protein [candidate division Zixibacteria bacterium]